jgi:hypothetical protein
VIQDLRKVAVLEPGVFLAGGGEEALSWSIGAWRPGMATFGDLWSGRELSLAELERFGIPLPYELADAVTPDARSATPVDG